MEIKKFNSASEFTDFLEAYYKETKDTWQYDVSIVAPFSQARDIATELIRRDFGMDFVENFSHGLLDDYTGDYEINICDGNIAILKAVDEITNEYNVIDSTICYVSDECSSKVLQNIYSEDTYELHIGEDDIDPDDGITFKSIKVNGKEVADAKTRDELMDIAFETLADYYEKIGAYGQLNRLLSWELLNL